MQHTDAKTPGSAELGESAAASSGVAEAAAGSGSTSSGSQVRSHSSVSTHAPRAEAADPATDLPPEVDPAVVDSVSAKRGAEVAREVFSDPAPGSDPVPAGGQPTDGAALRSEVHELAPARPDEELDDDLFVVGVGASAGGLDALEQFFGAMPEDTGMAFVVIQHLSPDFKSVMDELLARRTKIPIVLVEDGMPVEPNRIYLIPPKKEMIISGGRLLLSDKGASQELMLPIDIFFRSLAQELGERAVGVVLSGAGSDGARGIRDIHEAGGLVLSQDESTAYFDGMPRSARETGVVDFVLPPGQMHGVLLDHVRAPEERTKPDEEALPGRPFGVAA